MSGDEMVDFDTKVKQLFIYMDTMVERFGALKWHCLKEHSDLSLQELNAIAIIGKKNSCIMREVAGSMRLAVSTVTTIMDKLVAKELVGRKQSEEDRRIVEVSLTEKGKRVYLANLETQLGFTRAMLDTLDEDEQETFIILLAKMSEKLRKTRFE